MRRGAGAICSFLQYLVALQRAVLGREFSYSIRRRYPALHNMPIAWRCAMRCTPPVARFGCIMPVSADIFPSFLSQRLCRRCNRLSQWRGRHSVCISKKSHKIDIDDRSRQRDDAMIRRRVWRWRQLSCGLVVSDRARVARSAIARSKLLVASSIALGFERDAFKNGRRNRRSFSNFIIDRACKVCGLHFVRSAMRKCAQAKFRKEGRDITAKGRGA